VLAMKISIPANGNYFFMQTLNSFFNKEDLYPSLGIFDFTHTNLSLLCIS